MSVDFNAVFNETSQQFNAEFEESQNDFTPAMSSFIPGTTDWNEIRNKPSTFPPSAHSHSWESVTEKPTEFPPSAHNHDDRYYTENETDTLLANKQPTIDAQHKLSADLIADGDSNKTVTQAEKDAWDDKPDINDNSTTSTTETWSANKLNSVIGDIETLLGGLL